jgi:hypothetical protein
MSRLASRRAAYDPRLKTDHARVRRPLEGLDHARVRRPLGGPHHAMVRRPLGGPHHAMVRRPLCLEDSTTTAPKSRGSSKQARASLRSMRLDAAAEGGFRAPVGGTKKRDLFRIGNWCCTLFHVRRNLGPLPLYDLRGYRPYHARVRRPLGGLGHARVRRPLGGSDLTRVRRPLRGSHHARVRKPFGGLDHD